MIRLAILTDGEGAWPDMAGVEEAQIEAVARLPVGTSGGNSTVSFRLRMPDGRLVFAQTTMRLFLAAAGVFDSVERK